MAEYLELEKVLDDRNIITVQTKEYGNIDVIPVDTITDIPLADVQPVKRGKWIIVDDVEHFIAVCSECGRTEDSRGIKDMPYCHCGARMDGDANE